MVDDKAFLKQVLDTIPDQIVVINKAGEIVYVNHSWQHFAEQNNGTAKVSQGQHNYLQECKKAADSGDLLGFDAYNGLNAVIEQQQSHFYLEYPCHSDTVTRWFMMRVKPFKINNNDYYVINHHDITERKHAEDKIKQLARTDGLTGIYNRGYFDEFLASEWDRCRRLQMPLSLALIDLDDFKVLNDTYGHLQGDECLKQFAAHLNQFTQRPSDICARFGGEEFVIVYGNMGSVQAHALLSDAVAQFRRLQIPNKHSLPSKTLTVSLGLVTAIPNESLSCEALIKEADDLLYKAKEKGKDRLCLKVLE